MIFVGETNLKSATKCVIELVCLFFIDLTDEISPPSSKSLDLNILNGFGGLWNKLVPRSGNCCLISRVAGEELLLCLF